MNVECQFCFVSGEEELFNDSPIGGYLCAQCYSLVVEE